MKTFSTLPARTFLLCILVGTHVSLIASLHDSKTDFRWIYDGKSYTATFDYSSLEYKELRSENKAYDWTAQTWHYPKFVIKSRGNPTLETFAESLQSLAEEADLDEMETVDFFLNFVQSLTYELDPDLGNGLELIRYPLETLADAKGDCEDTAILLAYLLDYLGMDPILINPKRHVAVGIETEEKGNFLYGGQGYYAVETAVDGGYMEVGEFTQAYLDEMATWKVYEISDDEQQRGQNLPQGAIINKTETFIQEKFLDICNCVVRWEMLRYEYDLDGIGTVMQEVVDGSHTYSKK